MFADMEIDKKKNNQEQMDGDDRVVQIGGKWISKGLDGHGYSEQRLGRGGRPFFEHITRTTLEIKESKTLINDDGTLLSSFKGEVICPDYEFRAPFEADTKTWTDPKHLFEYLTSIAMERLDIANAAHMQLVAQAAAKFAAQGGAVARSTYRTIQGWYKDMYIMPSVVIDKAGIRENNQYRVDLSHKKYANKINFKLVDEEHLKDVLFHIKADLMTAFPKEAIYTGLSHVLMAGVRRQLGIKFKPTLWYEGLTGVGKSEIVKNLMCFYGEFGDTMPGWHASEKYIMDVCYEFKDCVTPVDDYKESFGFQVQKAAKSVVQYAYEEAHRGTLSRTGEAKIGKQNRSFIVSSGEDTPSQEASVLARMVIIPLNKRDMSPTKDRADKCALMRREYNCVMPYFIHWFLNQDAKVLTDRQADNYRHLINGMNGVQNAERIVQNLSISMLGWQMWVSFLEEKSIILASETNSYLEDFYQVIQKIKFDMANRCAEEQQSNVFLSCLRELLFAGEVRIEGLSGFDNNEHAKVIGFCKSVDEDLVYIYPGQAIKAVRTALRETNFNPSIRALSMQLFDSKVIKEKSKDRFVKKVRYKTGTKDVWVIGLTALGIMDIQENSFKIVSPLSDKVKQDEDGLF